MDAFMKLQSKIKSDAKNHQIDDLSGSSIVAEVTLDIADAPTKASVGEITG
jgi:hypothetical protein